MNELVVRASSADVHAWSGGREAVAALSVSTPGAGWAELPADAIWQATLSVVRGLVDTAPEAVLLTEDPGAVVLWDRETLGSPRPVVAPADRRTRGGLADTLAWVAEHEPHVWALVAEGRYAVGGLASYLLARATLGTWHLTTAASAAATGLLGDDLTWDVARCTAAGIPVHALPEVLTGAVAVRTEPRGFAGLDLPVRLGD